MTENSITECKTCSIYFPAPGEVLIIMNVGLRFSENISDTQRNRTRNQKNKGILFTCE